MPDPIVLERLVSEVGKQVRLRRAEFYGLRGLFAGAVLALVPLVLRELLGPPFEPMKQRLSGKDLWTYPMRIPGYPTPRWFLVQITPEGVLGEKTFIDDPQWVQPDSPRHR